MHFDSRCSCYSAFTDLQCLASLAWTATSSTADSRYSTATRDAFDL
ncbi:MAG: hypothetical protein IKY35_00305 [Muribaculaceae bacterium]|nr:hypothetical protein [Muribaculaceae bacterium]